MRYALALIATLLIPAAAAQAAEPPRLMVPAACTIDQSCWIVNHVDMSPAEGEALDFTCGKRAYDGHEGTDFGLKDQAAMKAGISALSAAPGKVLRVRDAMADKQPTPEEIDRMLGENKGCGNGVLIDHGNGWQSIYCHLKSRSVTVKPNDTVTAGQKIAEIGQSGAAEFPHLHFGLFFENRTIDPFSGTFAEDGCGKIKGPMWMDGINLAYEPMAVFANGFATGVPDFNLIRTNAASPPSAAPTIEALTFWVGLYGLRQGDTVKLDIITPDGSVFATRTITQDADRARQFYYVGRKVGEALAPGTYTGKALVERAITPGHPETLKREAAGTIEITPAPPGGQDAASGSLIP